MATGPLKRIKIDVKVSPKAGEKAGKLDSHALNERLVAAIRKILKTNDVEVKTSIVWYLPTAKGGFR